MSIVTEIQRLQSAKINIKTAIENKGVTVGDGTIDTYAEKIGEIVGAAAGGRLPKGIAEMQTGSFTVAEDTNETQYVAFNMQEAPTNFIVYADNDEQTAGTFLCLFYGDLFKSFTGVDKQYLIHHSTSSATSYGGGQRNFTLGGVQTIDKNGVSFKGYTASYYFRSSIKYNWIAWREGELDYDYNDYEQGYEDGKNSVVDCLPFLTTARFYSMNDFGKSMLELNLYRLTDLGSLFYESENSDETRVNKTVEHLTINSGQITGMYASFSCGNYSDTTLKRLTLNIDTSKCTGYYQTFRGRNALEVIDGTPLDFTSATTANNTFLNCINLAEVRFVPNAIKVNISLGSSANLSVDTTRSIIDGLADLTGAATQTLTVHSTVYQKIVDNGWDVEITAKNWTLVKA